MTRPDTAGQLPGGSAAVELKAVQVATRWLVGAATAVLAVLLAGVQLSALGQLASDRPGRLAIAVIACAVGLLAVGTILVLAARVLVSPRLDPEQTRPSGDPAPLAGPLAAV